MSGVYACTEVFRDKLNIGCINGCITQYIDWVRKTIRKIWSWRCLNRKDVRTLFLIRNSFGS